MVHQNRQTASGEKHQEKEVHKMRQSDPRRKPVRLVWHSTGWTDRNAGKTENQKLNPGNRDRDHYDYGDNYSFLRPYVDSEATVWRKMNGAMSLAECSHDAGWGMVERK
jgi:hypothetical protein